MKEEKGTGAEAESQSQLVAKEDNEGNFWDTSCMGMRITSRSYVVSVKRGNYST